MTCQHPIQRNYSNLRSRLCGDGWRHNVFTYCESCFKLFTVHIRYFLRKVFASTQSKNMYSLSPIMRKNHLGPKQRINVVSQTRNPNDVVMTDRRTQWLFLVGLEKRIYYAYVTIFDVRSPQNQSRKSVTKKNDFSIYS